MGVNIKMDTSKEKVINVHIEDGKTIHFKACSEHILYNNLNEPTSITNTLNVSLNDYCYLYMVKKSESLLILNLEERRKLENYSNIFTRQEHQNLRINYKKERSATSR